MVASVSTAGKLLFNIRNIRQQTLAQSDKSTQYQTGQKHDEIARYGKNVPLILNYRQEIEVSEQFVSSSQSVLNVLDVTDTALEQLDDVLDRLRAFLEQGLGFDSDVDPQLYDNWRDSHEDVADDLLREITDLLNSRVGERYIFAGGRYTDRPVVQLDRLDNGEFHVPEELIAAGDPADVYRPLTFDEFYPDATVNEVPDYDRSNTNPNVIADIAQGVVTYTAGNAPPYVYDTDEESYKSTLFNTGTTATQSYGVSSNEEDIARIIYVARSFKQALTQAPQASREATLRAALDEIEEADTGIRLLRQKEGTTYQTIDARKLQHEENKTFRENYLAELVTVDKETVSIELSALNKQIESTLALISGQRRLSLANYL